MKEGFRGLSKGMVLALFGVSNGAIQFMTYEELKKWRIELRRIRLGVEGSDEESKKLVSLFWGCRFSSCGVLMRLSESQSNVEYILMSGSAKLVAIGLTYPYQVIRSRIQVCRPLSLPSDPIPLLMVFSTQYQPPTITPYTSIPNCISRTYAAEGLKGFYKGLSTNAVRILPGTCVTFVVYVSLFPFLG